MLKIMSILLLVLSACFLPGASGAAESSNLEQGIAQYRSENFEEAQLLLEAARREQPDSSLAAFYLGMTRKQEGDLSGAIRDLTDAATLSPPLLDAYLELAHCHQLRGEFGRAMAWVAKAEEARIKPAQTAFQKGLILAAEGKREEAMRAFEQAKSLDPTLKQPADFQIAIALAGERQLGRARDVLRAVIAADPATELASYATEYEKSFTRIIASQRPLHLTLGLNYLYDDNAISNPSDATARTLIGNPTGERDHAFLGTLRLDYNPQLSGNAILNAQYLLQSTKYGNTDTGEENPSTLINSLTLIPGYALGNAALSLPVNYSHVLLREEEYQQTVTVRPTWSWQFAPQHILQTAFSYTRREMLKGPLLAAESRDSDIYGASLGYIHTYGEQGGMAGLRYDYSYDDTEGGNWLNSGHRVSLNAVVPLIAGLRLNLSGDVLLQDYLDTNTIFNVRRDDTIWLAAAGLSWNITPDIMISAQYAHTTSESNIPLYGYDRNTITTGVEFSF